MKEYLVALRLTPEFQNCLEIINRERPIVPLSNYNPDNTEEWKALSNMQRGFDLCHSLLSGHVNED
jgi:hypothetical protein